MAEDEKEIKASNLYISVKDLEKIIKNHELSEKLFQAKSMLKESDRRNFKGIQFFTNPEKSNDKLVNLAQAIEMARAATNNKKSALKERTISDYLKKDDKGKYLTEGENVTNYILQNGNIGILTIYRKNPNKESDPKKGEGPKQRGRTESNSKSTGQINEEGKTGKKPVEETQRSSTGESNEKPGFKRNTGQSNTNIKNLKPSDNKIKFQRNPKKITKSQGKPTENSSKTPYLPESNTRKKIKSKLPESNGSGDEENKIKKDKKVQDTMSCTITPRNQEERKQDFKQERDKQSKETEKRIKDTENKIGDYSKNRKIDQKKEKELTGNLRLVKKKYNKLKNSKLIVNSKKDFCEQLVEMVNGFKSINGILDWINKELRNQRASKSMQSQSKINGLYIKQLTKITHDPKRAARLLEIMKIKRYCIEIMTNSKKLNLSLEEKIRLMINLIKSKDKKLTPDQIKILSKFLKDFLLKRKR